MPTKCYITNCRSSSVGDKKNRRTLLKFPDEKDSEKRQKWLNAVGSNISEGKLNNKFLYICDLHFEDDCFKSDYSLQYIKKGALEQLTRQRKRLKANSLPSKFPVDTENSPKKKITSNKITRVSNSPSDPLKQTKSLENEKLLTVDKLSSLIGQLQGNNRYSEVETCLSHKNQSSSMNSESMIIVVKTEPTESEGEQTWTQGSMETPAQSAYSIDNLVEEWTAIPKGELPQNWCMIEKTLGVMFTYCGDTLSSITRTVIVDRNMNIKLQLNGRIVRNYSLDKILSLKDALNVLWMVSCYNICEGSDEGSLCPNGFYIRKPYSSSNRCKKCQETRKKNRNLELKKNKRKSDKILKEKTFIKNFKQKYKRYMKKEISAEEVFEGLKKETIQRPLKDKTNLKNKNSKPNFDPSLFKMLKLKCDRMNPEDRRGVLVLEEMKLSKAVTLDRNNLKTLGFTNLGAQKKEHGDHALVFLFQPFRGTWIQNVTAFLSKGSAKGKVLHRLITEAVNLLENHGLFVDAVTFDGETWNRKMWTCFGLRETDASCDHPCSLPKENQKSSGSLNKSKKPSKERKLWFCSDFSHLIKTLRNFIMSSEEIWTPDGAVKKKHYRAVLRGDERQNHVGLKIAPKLTPDHIDPEFYQKMNGSRAFDVFSSKVANAMNIYKAEDPDLIDCTPTIMFIERMDRLITAMTSRGSLNALKKDSESYEEIMDFRDYMLSWEDAAKENGYMFMSNNICLGFHISLRSTIEIFDFLASDCNYVFLRTARLNRDALEGMFGLIRECCGSDDIPDSLLFIQVYRFLTFYSLVKPPKCSNVKAIDIFDSLLTAMDASCGKDGILDKIVECNKNNPSEYRVLQDHDYNVTSINDHVQVYFSGFMSRKIERWTSCGDCLSSVRRTHGNSSKDQMIDDLSKGFLRYPSDQLVELLTTLENAILRTVGKEQLNMYTFQHIYQNVWSETIPFVGCSLHENSLTRQVMRYYVVCRMKMLCKLHNRKDEKSLKTAKCTNGRNTENMSQRIKQEIVEHIDEKPMKKIKKK